MKNNWFAQCVYRINTLAASYPVELTDSQRTTAWADIISCHS